MTYVIDGNDVYEFPDWGDYLNYDWDKDDYKVKDGEGK